MYGSAYTFQLEGVIQQGSVTLDTFEQQKCHLLFPILSHSQIHPDMIAGLTDFATYLVSIVPQVWMRDAKSVA